MVAVVVAAANDAGIGLREEEEEEDDAGGGEGEKFCCRGVEDWAIVLALSSS